MLATLRQRNFALLWVGGLISLTGDWALFVGLPLFVYRTTGSTLATGLMFMAGLLPRLALGSVAGVFVDRWDRRRTMVVVNGLLALSLLPLLAVRSADRLWIVYAVAFVESSLAQFVRPAESALLPRLVGEERLASANALNGLSNNLSRLIGPPLGGALAGAVGLSGVALCDAASFAVAGGLVALIAIEARPTGAAEAPAGNPWAATWRAWLSGLRAVGGNPALRVVFLFIALTGIGEGAMSTLFVPFVTKVLGGGDAGYGWLVAAQGVGGLLGSLAIGRIGGGVPPARLLGLGALGLGLIDLAIFNYHPLVPGLAPAFVLMIVVGLPASGIGVGLYTLLQTLAADAYLGRVFGAFGTTAALAQLVGTAAAGGLGDVLGIVPVISVQGVVYTVGGLLVLALLRGLARRPGPAGEVAEEPAAAL
ncbi:MAG TPA: MFS transporter [Thermomicrobiales bacterium]|nr:MFS transporter [Thermomicrobiales bacterium]